MRQDKNVIDDSKQFSVPHVEILSLSGQRIQAAGAQPLAARLVFQYVPEAQPALTAPVPGGDVTLFQEPVQVRPGNVQEVRGLAWGEFVVGACHG